MAWERSSIGPRVASMIYSFLRINTCTPYFGTEGVLLKTWGLHSLHSSTTLLGPEPSQTVIRPCILPKLAMKWLTSFWLYRIASPHMFLVLSHRCHHPLLPLSLPVRGRNKPGLGLGESYKYTRSDRRRWKHHAGEGSRDALFKAIMNDHGSSSHGRQKN